MTAVGVYAVRSALKGWFSASGAYVLVDGQFGSTGKGLLSAAIAETFTDAIDVIASNQGPNSGHTFVHNGVNITVKQLPVAGVKLALMGEDGLELSSQPLVYLNAGAVVHSGILAREIETFSMRNVVVHRSAALVQHEDELEDEHTLRAIASTGQGTGPALQRKLSRSRQRATYAEAPQGIFTGNRLIHLPAPPKFGWRPPRHVRTFIEVPQGFSLGINSGFYPYVTSRECTVSQGLSDCGLSPTDFRQSVMVVRTYPIRVGNVAGPHGFIVTSGPPYPDQEEIDWSDIGVDPEYTSVTQRQRRVFTWSDIQYRQALLANSPSAIFLNFCNYLKPGDVDWFVMTKVVDPYREIFGKEPQVLLGYGPRTEDIYHYRTAQ